MSSLNWPTLRVVVLENTHRLLSRPLVSAVMVVGFVVFLLSPAPPPVPRWCCAAWSSESTFVVPWLTFLGLPTNCRKVVSLVGLSFSNLPTCTNEEHKWSPQEDRLSASVVFSNCGDFVLGIVSCFFPISNCHNFVAAIDVAQGIFETFFWAAGCRAFLVRFSTHISFAGVAASLSLATHHDGSPH